MTTRTPVLPSAPRTALLGAAAAIAAAVLAQALGWAAGTLMETLQADEVIGANIGAGIVLLFSPPLSAPLLSWPLLRLLRVPRPGLAVLAALPVHLLWSGLVFWGFGLLADAWWPVALAGAAGFTVATAAGALIARPSPRGGASGGNQVVD